jgi:hypothetical protein
MAWLTRSATLGRVPSAGPRARSGADSSRVVVVAHLHEVEARLLGQHGLADQFLRAEGLRGQLGADLHALLLLFGPGPARATLAGAADGRGGAPTRIGQAQTAGRTRRVAQRLRA